MKRVYSEFDVVAQKVGRAVTSTEKVIEPMRSSLFKRFPTTLTLAVTFGVAATFYGTERLIAEIAWLNERPFLIFLTGIVVLACTGRLYQKLG